MSTELQHLTPFDDFSAPGDLGGAGGGFGGQGPDGAKRPGILHNLHRALRGKYLFIVPLSLACALGGAAAGWKSQKPVYKSEGTIQIKSSIMTPFDRTSDYVKPIQMYDEYMMTQVSIMTSRRCIDQALRDPAWVETGRGNDRATVTMFADNLTVEHPVRTQLLRVSLIDRDPGVAAAGVKAIVTAFSKIYNAGDAQNETRALEILETKKAELQRLIAAEKKEIDNIAQRHGSENVESRYQLKVQMVNDLDRRLKECELKLQLAMSRGDPAKYIDGLTPAQIGILDNQMNLKLTMRANGENELAKLSASLGERNPRIVELRRQLASQTEDLERYAKEWKSLKRQVAISGSSDVADLAASPEQIKAERVTLQRMYEEVHTQMVELGRDQLAMAHRQEKVHELEQDIRNIEKQMDQIKGERGVAGRLSVINDGDVPPSPHKDKRKAMAVAFGGAGGAAPILICFLLSSLNRRYRFSDDAENAIGMPPLLGILPTLPDRLSDPEQAAIAAHCIHQVRIMLQVSAQPDNKKVYLITSASTGDGKTSLTMALGLSFAASGSRTLVIDCDMVGQGLTHRLKARNSPGLLEALGNGSLQGKVKKTTTQNLYILPVGVADSAHAGGLSPQAIKRLLAEARKVFDTILIDTGPILGSLEAASVAAAADSVILAVARGQHQGLVERSVRQLRQVGAFIAGIVFNRAERRDFARSIGSKSIRSISSVPQPQRLLIEEGAEPSRFGPLARSVASFMPGRDGASAARALPPGPSAASRVNGDAHSTVNGGANGESTPAAASTNNTNATNAKPATAAMADTATGVDAKADTHVMEVVEASRGSGKGRGKRGSGHANSQGRNA